MYSTVHPFVKYKEIVQEIVIPVMNFTSFGDIQLFLYIPCDILCA